MPGYTEKSVKTEAEDKPRRKLSAPDRKEQIVSIAIGLIATGGLEGFRFQEVAREAGINNATLSYHFAGKEELVAGVMEHMSELLREGLGRPADRETTAREELRLEFEHIGALLGKQHELFTVFIELSMRATRDRSIAEGMSRLEDDWSRRLRAIVKQGRKAGAFRPETSTEEIASLLMAQIKGLIFQALTTGWKPKEVKRSARELALVAERWLTGDAQA